jgi:3-hydroxyacyl-CoA dehydrogenase/enoyl-CoA hydratase/3-hydroxybutyryl-CoA epimerase/3-hydroxyacyl-CoA dehydrogenase/enoyl-CoA hydratase/3-hydroxybutyryl-CoA epimerase/enoyl-CoA isomerase
MTSESANQTSAVSVSECRPDIALMTLDLPGKGANILSDQMFRELDEAITPLLHRDDLRGLILYSAKPRIFVAGADLVAIASALDWPDERIIRFCDDGRAVMAKFSQVPFPTVAAIHGACVGGGLELTLWCDRRIVSDDRATILGLPEVKLGLIPGWAGTLRVARWCGLKSQHAIEHQLDLVTSGRLIHGQEAMDMGLVEQVIPKDELIDAAVALIDAEFESQAYLDDRESVAAPLKTIIDEHALVGRFGTAIVENQDIYPFAPTVALEHMLRAAQLPMRQACDSESVAMAQVWGSPASYGLINNFFLTEHNKKKPGFVDLSLHPEPVDRVGIIGAGVMGRAIAINNLNRRKSVAILDSNSQIAAEFVEELTQQHESILQVTEFSQFADCNLVLESAVENTEIKKEILVAVESSVSPETMIATNTSAIPITQLAGVLNYPARLCGIHFCHPELMSLVEVIRGPLTSEQTVARATAYVRSLGKMPVVVKDRAGFVVNRLLSAMLDQAFRLLAEGYSVRQIDEALREFGFRGGPFEMIDVIGADTCLYAGRSMWDAGLTCVTDSLVLPRMVKLGWLGRKTGRGFYRYDAPDGPAIWDEGLDSQLAPYRKGESVTEADAEMIVNSILSAIVLAGSNLVDEGIVADPRDVDLCIIHGFSFPAHQGGVLFWADRFGIKNVIRELERISQTVPRLAPTENLLSMRDEKRKFY